MLTELEFKFDCILSDSQTSFRLDCRLFDISELARFIEANPKETMKRDILKSILQNRSGSLGIKLSLAQLELFQRYFYDLTEWNSRANLTSVTDWTDVQIKHYMDSLTVAITLPKQVLNSGRFVDIGSGGGFPGVPLMIAFPNIKVTLIEATRKKYDFLLHLRDTLQLHSLSIFNDRAEILAHDPSLREQFDVVLARSIARMATLSELTLPFCRIGGLVVAHKSKEIQQELKSACRAISATGGILRQIQPITIEGLSARTLVVLEKVSQTSNLYPRRPGMPSKRPL